MTAPGLTPQGFVATTVDEEVQDLNGKVLANVRADLDLSPDQPFGQVIGIFAEKFAEAMEVLQTVYDAINPNAAEGQLLVNDCALSGTYPQVATFSTVTVNLTLNNGTTVTAGAVMSVANQPSNRWSLVTTVTNSTGSTGVFPVTFKSAQPGPFVANAGTLTVINTPVGGWLSGTNPLDATPGLAADTDTTLRQRRAVEVSGEGSGDIDSIRAAILRLGAIQCFVFENTTLVTDVFGNPPKSIRVVVFDGAVPTLSNTAIAQAIWDHKCAGIQAAGGITATATDSAGNPQTIHFDRPTPVPIYVSCSTTPATLTASQTQGVKDALKAYATTNWNLGTSVIAVPFRAAAVVPGVTTDVPLFQFDTHGSPTNTGNLILSNLQIPTLDTAHVLVNGI